MRKSQIGNSMWSYHTSGHGNSNDPWPELCQRNDIKRSVYNDKCMNSGENETATVTLDSYEYPELDSVTGNGRHSVRPRERCLPTRGVQILIPVRSDMESSGLKSSKRYKRSNRIRINLREALESTKSVTKTNKQVPKLRINVSSGNVGITVGNTLDKNKNVEFRKFRICVLKNKKPSKLKKIILLNRDIKAQINADKRETFERKKIEAVCKDVDAINFNCLKITADPEIDVDYARNMRTLKLYDNDYRSSNEINICDGSLSYRPDVIEKMNDLKVEGTGNTSDADVARLDIDAIENDIVEQTLSLRLDEGTQPRQLAPNLVEVDDKNFRNIKHSRNFREYCTNMLTAGLNNSLEAFLQEIARLQKRLHEKNPNKSKYKRRYYSGFKQVRKRIELRKLKFVIVAPDIEKVELDDGLDDQIDELLDACRRENVVFCFGLRRRKLGYHAHGKGFVGCVGIVDYNGTELLFKNVLTELVHARNAFEKLKNGATDAIIDISKVMSDDWLLSENINALLNALVAR
ncbi:unnamed protein product [Xylocopa violacea]|uniref:Ribosomal protein eL8/eL30/eS12/Gadd45 domain-containing protein n=1 Tax=Xylocopa violacea TaxID=135666 RepID=A0ABP1NGE1_XYLVO